jgi:hypothetical protein
MVLSLYRLYIVSWAEARRGVWNKISRITVVGIGLVAFATAVTVFHLRRSSMARKYSKGASKFVERAMKKRNKGTLKSGRSGKRVKSRKQAIAIGLSEARKKGKKVPRKKRL